MKVEFECIVCSTRAVASVAEEAAAEAQGPLRTLNACERCGQETIWLEVGRPED